MFIYFFDIFKIDVKVRIQNPLFLAIHIVNCTKSTQHLQIYFLLLLSFKIRDFYLFSHLEWKSQEKSFVKLSKTESTVNLGLIVILLKNVEK